MRISYWSSDVCSSDLEVGQVFADVGTAGEQPEVLVGAGRLGVVVAGADVAVATYAVGLVAHDQCGLRVHLEPDQAVDDVHAGGLERLGPLDVGALVEASLELDQDQIGRANV